MTSTTDAIALTGATGFVGLNLVDRLARRGRDVRCLVRPGSNTAHLRRWPVTVRRIDLSDGAALMGALSGCRALLHVANDPVAPAAIPIRTVGEAAVAAGVEHLVFFSTAAVHDIHRGDYAITAESPTRPESDYSRYKAAAERVVAELCASSPMAFTILRPTNVYGPWDLKGVLFRWFLAAGEGDLTVVGGGRNRIHLCHVANLVDLTAETVLNEAAYGRTYFAADPRAETLRDILTAICRTAGRRLEELPLPGASLPLVERLMGRVNRGRRPFRLAPKLRAHLRHDYQVDVEPAERDLGYRPALDLETGTVRTAAWYREFGVL